MRPTSTTQKHGTEVPTSSTPVHPEMSTTTLHSTTNRVSQTTPHYTYSTSMPSCGQDILKCMPITNIEASDGSKLTGDDLKQDGWSIQVPVLPSDELPYIVFKIGDIDSSASHAVEKLMVSGNIATVTVEFYENGNFISPPEYTLLDATRPILFEPPKKTVYLKIIYNEAVPLSTGQLPENYVASFGLTGCFSFQCRKYLICIFNNIFLYNIELDCIAIN